MKLPFSWTPAAWGLKGDSYAEAEANYYLTGETLDRKLMQIRYRLEPDILAKKLLDIDFKYVVISRYEYETQLNKLEFGEDEIGLSLAQIDTDLKHKHLSPYEAAIAKIKILRKEDYDEAKIDVDLEFLKISEYDARIAKLNLKYDEDSIDYKLGLIDINQQFKKISDYEAERERIQLRYKFDDCSPEELNDRKIALLELDYKFSKVTKNEYEKRMSTYKNQPWVSFAESTFDPEKGLDGVFIELEWNNEFIELLKLHGYVGHNEEQIVDEWFAEVCKSYALPENLNQMQGLYPMGYDGKS